MTENAIANIETKEYGSDDINIIMIRFLCPFSVPYNSHIVNYSSTNPILPGIWKEGWLEPIPETETPRKLNDLRHLRCWREKWEPKSGNTSINTKSYQACSLASDLGKAVELHHSK
ncbi:hypothetical protein JTB14_001909 [Gonioctena quinquepunctata]|nr:hypothetical protein JTB14_001909 [Gonioctena quinquepunctata]